MNKTAAQLGKEAAMSFSKWKAKQPGQKPHAEALKAPPVEPSKNKNYETPRYTNTFDKPPKPPTTEEMLKRNKMPAKLAYQAPPVAEGLKRYIQNVTGSRFRGLGREADHYREQALGSRAQAQEALDRHKAMPNFYDTPAAKEQRARYADEMVEWDRKTREWAEEAKKTIGTGKPLPESPKSPMYPAEPPRDMSNYDEYTRLNDVARGHNRSALDSLDQQGKEIEPMLSTMGNTALGAGAAGYLGYRALKDRDHE